MQKTLKEELEAVQKQSFSHKISVSNWEFEKVFSCLER